MNKKNRERYEPFIVDFFRNIKKTFRNPLVFVCSFATSLIIIIPSLKFDKDAVPLLAGNLIIYLLLSYLFFFCLCGSKSTGRRLSHQEFYLLLALTAFYFIAANFLGHSVLYDGNVPVSTGLPTALIIMLSGIMVSIRHAQILSLLLPLTGLLTGRFDFYAFLFALTSGISAAFVLHGVKERIDMVKAGLVVALVNSITMTAILLYTWAALSLYPVVLLFAALNGITSGMLVLGMTPLFERLLHSATAFRLIELLDLGAPLMRLLASKTPGTYNHSLVVANLAESACQEIGANSLLGRVGAYYHDIGKIDQPEYFTENQQITNKHDDINPRLSATVIRSHVKVGIEKGRAAGLPNDVLDIIASHHGNSLIAYFYNEAVKKEGTVNMEDFCYPGHPPRTKEAAVIMLADVTEAAVRTLDKPSTSRLEKFINELIMRKVDSSQLSESELTFRELETIKKIFVRVLASYYHTRIEYPNQPKKDSKDDA